jgi:hypothetical protein
VIHVYNDGRSESRAIEGTWHVNEARQNEQAQGRGGQVGDLIQWSGAQQTKFNCTVGRVESQRDPSQQYRDDPGLNGTISSLMAL